jgi:hypothetical protein
MSLSDRIITLEDITEMESYSTAKVWWEVLGNRIKCPKQIAQS